MPQADQSHALFGAFAPTQKPDWLQKLSSDLKGKTAADLIWKTGEGLEAQAILTREDPLTLPQAAAPLLLPGQESNGEQARHWVNMPVVVVQDSATANQQALQALNTGAEGICFDLRSSQPAQLAACLQGIGPSYCELAFIVNDQVTQWLDQYKTWLGAGQHDLTQIKGYLHWAALSDPSTDYGRSETETLTQLLRAAADLPHFSVVHTSLLLLHEQGANPVQELATMLAWLSDWADRLTEAGLPVEVLLKSLSFTLPCGPYYFIEIAKFRAARLLLSQFARAWGIDSAPGSWSLGAQTPQRNKSVIDAESNILRNTTEAMSAIIGGADRLSISPHDALSIEQSSYSERIARNISTLLREESQLGKTADAAAGSYYIAHLTEQLCKEAWGAFRRIEKGGGLSQMNEVLQAEIKAAQTARMQRLAQGKATLVGINQYADALKQPAPAKTTEERLASRYEQLRHAAASLPAAPAALLVKINNDAMGRARAAFSRDFLATAGITCTETTLDELPQTVAPLIVLCGADEQYTSGGILAFSQLRTCFPEATLLLAGAAGTLEASLAEAGMQGSIHRKVHKADTLQSLLRQCWNLTIS